MTDVNGEAKRGAVVDGPGVDGDAAVAPAEVINQEEETMREKSDDPGTPHSPEGSVSGEETIRENYDDPETRHAEGSVSEEETMRENSDDPETWHAPEGLVSEETLCEKSDDPETRNTPEGSVPEEAVAEAASGMELNVAYEALESMRIANLSLELGEGVKPAYLACRCTRCLRGWAKRGGQRWGSMMKLQRNFPSRCLICGSPACQKHCSAEFRKEGIKVCSECARLFDAQFLVCWVSGGEDDETDADEEDADISSRRRDHVRNMLDAYDRALLMLWYSSSYIDTVAEALEKNAGRNNRIGLTSSATNFASGAMGIAAAVAIFTPAGPPLLIASLLFGGTATAVGASSEAVNYHSEPNKIAERIIALYGVVNSILGATSVFCDALLERHDEYERIAQLKTVSMTSSSNSLNEETMGTIVKSAVLPRSERGKDPRIPIDNSIRKAKARSLSRSTTNVLKGTIPMASAVLGPATIIMESREMYRTVRSIRAGNPCEKAKKIREIKAQLGSLPETAAMDQEFCKYLALMDNQEGVERDEKNFKFKQGAF